MLDDLLNRLNIDKEQFLSTTPIFKRVKQVGNLLYTSGHGTIKNGVRMHCGKVGEAVSVEEARQATEIAIANSLISIESHLGNLNKVEQIVKVNGFVNCVPEFEQQSEVLDPASVILLDLFGSKGDHARTAIGVGSLPNNIPVEVELVLEINRGNGG